MLYFNSSDNNNSCYVHNFGESFSRFFLHNFAVSFLTFSLFNLDNRSRFQPNTQLYKFKNENKFDFYNNPWKFEETSFKLKNNSSDFSPFKFTQSSNVWVLGGYDFNLNTNYDVFKFTEVKLSSKEDKVEDIDFDKLSSAELKKIKKECYSPEKGFSLESKKIDMLYKAMGLDEKGLNKEVFTRAIEGYNNLSDKGNGYLGIFDTTQGSDKERYYMLDLNNLKLIGQTVIKEGSGNMSNIATANKSGSHATLSGFEKVGTSYKSQKSWEKGIHLHGLEEGINDTALARSCVAHYTTGNSTWGCKGITPVIENGKINKDKSFAKLDKFFPEGAIIFTYPKDENYWNMSELYA